MNLIQARADLRRQIDQRLDFSSSMTDQIVAQLLDRSRDAVLAVIYYGSCLTGTASADSEPDFYVVVDRLQKWHDAKLDVLLNLVLPPNIYHPMVYVDGAARRSKLCVIAAWQLVRETSTSAADLYHLGRFSKRMGLVWARNASARALIVDAQTRSIEVLTPLALARLGERFTLDEYLIELLGLSYLSEQRIFEPAKLRSLLDHDGEYLRSLGRCALHAECCRRAAFAVDGLAEDAGAYRQHILSCDGARLDGLLRRSRHRALARWPKHLVTFDGWLDYLLAKLERHSGIQLHLTPIERRHPVLLAWPRLLELHRRGIVR